jgi:hypothetical protein
MAALAAVLLVMSVLGSLPKLSAARPRSADAASPAAVLLTAAATATPATSLTIVAATLIVAALIIVLFAAARVAQPFAAL